MFCRSIMKNVVKKAVANRNGEKNLFDSTVYQVFASFDELNGIPVEEYYGEMEDYNIYQFSSIDEAFDSVFDWSQWNIHKCYYAHIFIHKKFELVHSEPLPDDMLKTIKSQERDFKAELLTMPHKAQVHQLMTLNLLWELWNAILIESLKELNTLSSEQKNILLENQEAFHEAFHTETHEAAKGILNYLKTYKRVG